jgi:hypothetical protein
MFYQREYKFTPEEVIDYLRKSQSDDPTLTVEEVLQKHEAMLDEWAEKNLGGKVPEENKFREVVSGETLKNRPEINKVLRLIESPKYKAVKVVEPQRLTRGDLEDIGRLMKLLKHSHTVVITLTRIYDLQYEDDWDALERELKRGNDYLEYTKKILNRGRLLSVSQGNYLGNVAPYGFDKTIVMDGKRKCPTLKENVEEAEIVRMIFDLYVNQDMGRYDICHKLDRLGVKPPKGEHWSPYTVRDMLDNVHYIGKVRWNKNKTVHIVEDGEIIATRPRAKEGEYLIFEGRHDGIVSEELFNAALDKIGRNYRAKPKTKIRNPLSGLLFCRCGRSMALRMYKNKDGSDRSPARLLCDGQVYCNTGSCLFDEMMEIVQTTLQQKIEDFEIKIEESKGDSGKTHANIIKSLEKRLKDLQEKELAQWEAQAHPDPAQRMPANIFKQLNERLQKEKEETEQALYNAYNEMPKTVDYEKQLSTFSAALEAIQDPNASAAYQNKLLKACIERIDYNREKPQRIRSTAKRVTVNGKRIKPDGLPTGANWTTPPIEVDVQLRV